MNWVMVVAGLAFALLSVIWWAAFVLSFRGGPDQRSISKLPAVGSCLILSVEVLVVMSCQRGVNGLVLSLGVSVLLATAFLVLMTQLMFKPTWWKVKADGWRCYFWRVSFGRVTYYDRYVPRDTVHWSVTLADALGFGHYYRGRAVIHVPLKANSRLTGKQVMLLIWANKGEVAVTDFSDRVRQAVRRIRELLEPLTQVEGVTHEAVLAAMDVEGRRVEEELGLTVTAQSLLW